MVLRCQVTTTPHSPIDSCSHFYFCLIPDCSSIFTTYHCLNIITLCSEKWPIWPCSEWTLVKRKILPLQFLFFYLMKIKIGRLLLKDEPNWLPCIIVVIINLQLYHTSSLPHYFLQYCFGYAHHHSLSYKRILSWQVWRLAFPFGSLNKCQMFPSLKPGIIWLQKPEGLARQQS